MFTRVVGCLTLALLLSACISRVNEVTPTPANTKTPTSTRTPEPTTTPTLEPTPTIDWTIEEMPLSWWEENFAIAQQGDPNVSLELAACVQFNEELCVRGVGYCPEGTECVGMMVISPISASLTGGTSSYFEQPGVKISNAYYVVDLWDMETFETQSMFAVNTERDLFVCMTGRDRRYILLTKMFVPVNKAVLDAIRYASGGNSHYGIRSLSECEASSN